MQVDFRIMCENAMIYNKPETIYHKAARKMLHSGMKILSQVGYLKSCCINIHQFSYKYKNLSCSINILEKN